MSGQRDPGLGDRVKKRRGAIGKGKTEISEEL